MPTINNYIAIILLIAWNPSYAQLKNDSVFSASTLSSIRLFDIAEHRPASLEWPDPTGRPVLFVFLSPECPLCQNYSTVLNQLDHRYAGKIRIFGIIPGKSYRPEDITVFAQKYKIGYPLLIDSLLRLSHYLRASTTPEVILLDAHYQLLYKGAIDNWYRALGKSRIKATENYLQDALDHSFRKESPAPKRTTPIGCLINDF